MTPVRKSRFRRRATRGIAAILTLLLLAGIAGLYLLRSTAGARWITARLVAREPRLALQVLGGTLWNGLHLRDLSWFDGANRFSLATLETRWTVSLFPRPGIRIHHLHADGLRIDIASEKSTAPADPEPFRLLKYFSASQHPPVELPDLHLPLDIHVRSFDLRRVTLNFGGDPRLIASLRFSADWIGDLLTIHRFHLDHEQGQVEASGTLRPADDYPLDLSIRIRSDRLLPPHDLSLDLSLTQSLADLAFTARLVGPGVLEAHGEIHPLDPHRPMRATLTWSQLVWPLQNEPVVTSESGRLDLRGSLESAAIDAVWVFSGTYIPEGRWT
ncbi:MAG: hypothetical protein U1E27_06595, partial [Kiritimatiellia bacterium]|nr:hypothetical protein [Kiritimatiellia bacterium]